MIKVNLLGAGRKKPAKAGMKINLPGAVVPVLLILIVLGFAAGGYWWYSDMTGRSAALSQQIAGLEARKKKMDETIKAIDTAGAERTKIQKRVKVIQDLQNQQASPVIVLDQLAEAVEKTKFVWLSSLDQKESILNMSGVGTSLSAIADFYTNLNATGYFKNIDLGPSQESSGNFTFSLKCEFSPPRNAESNTHAATAGGN